MPLNPRVSHALYFAGLDQLVRDRGTIPRNPVTTTSPLIHASWMGLSDLEPWTTQQLTDFYAAMRDREI